MYTLYSYSNSLDKIVYKFILFGRIQTMNLHKIFTLNLISTDNKLQKAKIINSFKSTMSVPTVFHFVDGKSSKIYEYKLYD